MAVKEVDSGPEEVKQKPVWRGGKGLLIIMGILVFALDGEAFVYIQFTDKKRRGEGAWAEEKKAAETALVALDPKFECAISLTIGQCVPGDIKFWTVNRLQVSF